MSQGPILFDLAEGEETRVHVADAPPVPDAGGTGPGGAGGAAMQGAARVATRAPSRLARWFWGLAAAVAAVAVSVAAWDFATALVQRAPILGWAVAGLLAALALVVLAIFLREAAAIGRLGRIDGLRRAAGAALEAGDLEQARAVARRLVAFYRGRAETRRGAARLEQRVDEQFEADALLVLAEDEILAPLDAQALREVETAARQVATVTALVPLALADVAAALLASLRMIRRVAEIYGGRSGLVGSWRLTRAVLAHLAATGAIAAGDDLLEPVLGGSILSKLSRRFGEGLVNGALSARVGVAAMEVCRPLPFSPSHRPAIRVIVGRALGGLVAGGGERRGEGAAAPGGP